MGQIDGRSGERDPDAGAGGGVGGGSRQVPERLVPWLLLLLAAAAGALDAVCLIRLGGLFASVITGNLVQLGRSLATVDPALLVGAVTSVGGYAIGVAAGSLGLRRPGGRRRGADQQRGASRQRGSDRPRETDRQHGVDQQQDADRRRTGDQQPGPDRRGEGDQDTGARPRDEGDQQPGADRRGEGDQRPGVGRWSGSDQRPGAERERGMVSSRGAGRRRGVERVGAVGGWGRRAGIVAAGEFVLLVAVAVGWVASAAWPPEWLAMSLLGLGAAAMGVQSALSIESGAGSASTTYLTGTLTAVVRTLSGTPWRRSGVAGGVTRLAALLCGAAAGTILLNVAQLYVVFLPVALVGAVAAMMLAATWRRRPAVRS